MHEIQRSTYQLLQKRQQIVLGVCIIFLIVTKTSMAALDKLCQYRRRLAVKEETGLIHCKSQSFQVALFDSWTTQGSAFEVKTSTSFALLEARCVFAIAGNEHYLHYRSIAAGKVTVGKQASANVPRTSSSLFDERLSQDHKSAVQIKRRIIWLGISMIENVSAISIASEFISFLWWLLTNSMLLLLSSANAKSSLVLLIRDSFANASRSPYNAH